MNDLSVITLHSEVTRLRAALDDVAHAHERDLMRLARALGFTHEPPDVDALVAAAERDHELADMVGANQAMAARETARAAALEEERDTGMTTMLAGIERLEGEVERLRAELAAERTEHAAHEGTLRLERDALRAELDALPALLRLGIGGATPPRAAKSQEELDAALALLRGKGRTRIEFLHDNDTPKRPATPEEDDAFVTVYQTALAFANTSAESLDRLREERNDIREGARYVGASVDRVITLDGVELVSALARDTARRDLDAVRRVLAEALTGDGEDEDLDALALAAKAAEAIDHLVAKRDEALHDHASARNRARALSAERDALARGETAPSPDAIRAHAVDGAGWLAVWRADGVPCGYVYRLSLDDRGRILVHEANARGLVAMESPAGLAQRHPDARWWRVAADGSLAVAEASS